MRLRDYVPATLGRAGASCSRAPLRYRRRLVRRRLRTAFRECHTSKTRILTVTQTYVVGTKRGRSAKRRARGGGGAAGRVLATDWVLLRPGCATFWASLLVVAYLQVSAGLSCGPSSCVRTRNPRGGLPKSWVGPESTKLFEVRCLQSLRTLVASPLRNRRSSAFDHLR